MIACADTLWYDYHCCHKNIAMTTLPTINKGNNNVTPAGY